MSLLGRQVFANPTTPLWGQGGGGGGSNPTFNSVSFSLPGGPAPIASQTIEMSSIPYASEYQLGVFDPSGNLGRLQIGNILEVQQPSSAGGTDDAVSRMLYAYDGIDYQQANSGTSIEFLQISSGSNSWDLKNINSINGVPYSLLPATRYDYQEYPGGVDVSAAPAWGALNTFTLTPPVNGKIFLQSQGSFVSQIIGGGVGMTFAINGTNIPELPASITAFQGNTNVPLTNFYSFPVSANTPYTIQSVAQRSVVPPEPGTDMVVIASRMFLSFSPQ